MPNPKAPLKLGANLWNQYTDWPAFLDGMLRADDLGFDSLFTWIDVYPIVGTWEGPALEAYTAMAAVASQTKRATHRAPRQRQHVPQPGAAGQRWSPPSTTSAVVAPCWASALPRSPSTRPTASSTATVRARGYAGWRKRCPSSAACSTGRNPARRRTARYAARGTQRPAVRSASHPHPHRRQRTEGHAAPRRRVRRHEQPGQSHRGRGAARNAILLEHCGTVGA